MLGYTSLPGDGGDLVARYSDITMPVHATDVPDWEEGPDEAPVHVCVHVFVAFYRHLRAVLEGHGVLLEHVG